VLAKLLSEKWNEAAACRNRELFLIQSLPKRCAFVLQKRNQGQILEKHMSRFHFQLEERWVYKWYLSTAYFYFSPFSCLFYVRFIGSKEFPEEFLMLSSLPFHFPDILWAKLASINNASSKCNFSLKF